MKMNPEIKTRWISGSTHTEPPVGATVTQEVEPVYDHLNGFTSDGGWFVEFGPFEEWWAEKVEAT